MKGKLSLMMLMFAGLFLLLNSQHKAVASSQIFIEGKSSGYQYVVIKEQETFTWEIGFKGTVSIIEENENNEGDLDKFRNIVEDISMQKFKLIFSACYFLLVVAVLFIARKKKYLRKLY